MYEYIKGVLIESTPQHAVVDVHGIGYKLFSPVNTLSRMPEIGQTVLLYASYVIRETNQTLYGFITRQEKELFELLITVSGIGPKIAIALLGHLELNHLVRSIRNSQLAHLCKVPGIGKKTAERLVLEIKDKLPAFMIDDSEHNGSDKPCDLASQKIQDAMSALINLGYSQLAAQRAIKQVLDEAGEAASLTTLITLALQRC
jgi:Holliday junction DNA helicase RuvA